MITLLGSGLLLVIRPLLLMSASAPFSHDLHGNAPSAGSLRARTPPAGDEVGNHQQQIPVAVAECFIGVRADGGGQCTDEGSGAWSTAALFMVLLFMCRTVNGGGAENRSAPGSIH